MKFHCNGVSKRKKTHSYPLFRRSTKIHKRKLGKVSASDEQDIH